MKHSDLPSRSAAWLMLACAAAWAAAVCADESVTLAWDPNPEPDLGGYIVYYGPRSRVYTNAINVGNVTTNTVSGLEETGTYYFAVTAYNTNGLESDFSDEVSWSGARANRAPVVNAGPDLTVTLPNAATLRGTATDDGLPNPPGALTLSWSKVSGPGTVTFANAAATNTTATFSAAGTYVLRLTANDGALSASDDVTVTVHNTNNISLASVTNRPPSVHAGAGFKAAMAKPVTLAGAVSDDGLPDPPGKLTTFWSKVSGPGAVTFANALATNTTVSFSTPGTYVLRLTASDGDLSASADVTVIVSSNSAPVVNAGPDLTVTLPNPAVLRGTVIDDGLPNPPGALTISWSKVSGPGTVTFYQADWTNATAVFSTNGLYVLRLTAKDGALSAADEVTVEVRPASEPGTNTPPVISAIEPQVSPMGEQIGPIPFTVGDAQTPAANLVVWAVSTNRNVVCDENLIVRGSGANRTLLIATNKPNRIKTGTTLVLVMVSDGSLVSTTAFPVTYLPLAQCAKAPLTVLTNRLGTVYPNLNGAMLIIGKTYELRARPQPYCIFTGWSGGVSGSSDRLLFKMQSNLVIQANFDFHPVAGFYNGLFYELEEVRPHSSGFFQAQVDNSRRFSAKLLLGGATYAWSGQLEADGRFVRVFQRRNAAPLQVELWAREGADQITGYVTDGSWVAVLLADRSIAHSRLDANAYTGAYTMALSGSEDPDAGPSGCGFATAQINTQGRVSYTGQLADSTPVTHSAYLSRRGELPIYHLLYNRGGSLLGWLTLTNLPSDDGWGRLSWIKPTQPKARYYPGGFTNEPVVIASRFEPPQSSTNRVLNLTNAWLVLGIRELPTELTNTITLLSTNNRVVNTSSNRLTVQILARQGLFQGTCRPATTNLQYNFKGILLQKRNCGYGYFLGRTEAGYVRLDPAP